MSQLVVIQLDERLYRILQEEAMAAGVSVEELAAVSLERRFQMMSRVPSSEHAQAGQPSLERHFGEIDLGYPTGADNSDIDADLGRECSDMHEAE
ncbi:MAG: hypothetical protein ACQESR_14725 [Planctomycetota bacterium]